MDGILYDSEYFYMHGTIEQLRSFGYEGPDEDVYRIIGTTLEQTFVILHELLDKKVSVDQLRESNDRYFLKEHPIDFKAIMFPGIPEELRKLKEMGLRLALCSSSPIETINDSLKAMEITELFDFVVSAENLPQPKPAPDVYLLAADKLQLRTDDCVVYEDSKLGIEAGKRAGIFTVAREDRRFNQDQSAADLIVKDIQELTAYIRKENGYA